MAPFGQSWQTQTTINISQDAKSSPETSADARSQVQVENMIDRVEDSVEDMPKIFQGGAVQRPPSTQHEQEPEDELYSLSPQVKASQKKTKTATGLAKPAMQNGSEQRNDTGDFDERDASYQGRSNAAGLSVVDALLLNGATVHEARPKQPIRAKGEAQITDLNGDVDELQASDDGLSGPIGSHPKSSKRPQSSTSAGRPNALDITSLPDGRATARVTTKAETSAVAALQARRQAQADGAEPGSRKSVLAATAGSMSTSVAGHRRPQLQAPRKAVRTPARSAVGDPQTANRPATGKLPPRKTGVTTQRPAETYSKRTQPRTKRHDPEDVSGESDTIAAGQERSDASESVHPAGKGALKAPTRARRERKAKEDMAYRMSPSSSEEESSRPPKKARTSKASTAKPSTKQSAASTATTAKSSKAIAPGPSAGSALRSVESKRGRSEKKLQAGHNDPKAATTARARMKSGSNEEKFEAAVRPPATKRAPNTQHDEEGERENHIPNGDLNDESLADFENQVIAYDGDQGSGDLGNAGTVNEAQPHGLTARLTRPTSGFQGDILVKRDDPSGRRASKQKQGTSQDDPVILSDQSALSSPRSHTPPLDRVSIVANRPRGTTAKAEAPKTPAVLHSSPPIVGKKSSPAMTKGLVDTNTLKRATIISFGKSGPRNQGSLSAYKGIPGSARTNRSSFPPAADLAAPSTSSRARLEARNAHGPSSAATSVKSIKTNKSAAPSNVAEDVPDALAGFFKKGKKGKEREAATAGSAPRDGQGLAMPVAPIPDNDDYTNIDDFEGTTFVDAQPAEEALEDTKLEGRPSDSQVAMPPPALKLLKSPRPHKAPTVPLMFGSEHVRDLAKATHVMKPAERTKRKIDADMSADIAPKRMRASVEAGRILPDVVQTVQSPSRESKIHWEPTVSHRDNRSVPEPIKRDARKPSRHTSQGSQKVDIHGSPVPQGMFVEGQATVLEVFSQQAGISSDSVPNGTVVTRKGATVQRPDTVLQNQELPPPSRQPQAMSSNRKPLPAPPQEPSRAITSLGRIERGRLMVEDRAEKLATDPFTSSEEARQHPSRTSSSSNFIEQLRRLATQDPRGEAQQEDPDKTLVEPEKIIRKPKRVVSISSQSSSELSSPAAETPDSVRDLGVWRNALLPHQMNMFDELVNVAHRIVCHLVDSETAATNIVEDYRRRGIQLIEQMELTHAKQHQKYVATLEERKKRLRKDLSEWSRKLQESTATVSASKRRRVDQRTVQDEVSKKLRDLMAEYC
ncbi:hypothetical protein LTR37_005130 [Vermiconidia calcicola]|uniref:Uncharacterized protein n=1 Tax=Vermiconidia calcicola TaxID=1690605 RepID=A0ACC3NJT6_9PEZI|nr:hypothetical protein LTR37_005130 [Vermiconidia calcicola]